MEINRLSGYAYIYLAAIVSASARYFRFTASVLLALMLVTVGISSSSAAFVTFESGQVRPLAISPDNSRLFAVNTPDGMLEIYSIQKDGLVHTNSVAVGMEPVSVAIRGTEAWVVNHLSDSVSIVDVAVNPPRVKRTLLVGDEPRDIVFAGFNNERAFITTAHRGQHSPYSPVLMPTNPGEMTTAGIGRADVWVFDVTNPGVSIGGSPLKILTLFTDTPRALAVSSDGNTVYAAGFHTGNKTAVINEGAVCNGGALAASCVIGGFSAPGGLPAPNMNNDGITGPEVGLIVKHNGVDWVDELGRSWNNQVPFSLPDSDVFSIDVNHTNLASGLPTVASTWSGVGTIIYNMIVNPGSGKIYVSNTDANNAVRFEGTRASGDTTSSVVGNIHKARISVIDGGSVTPRHLNKHINYSVVPAPAGIKENSLSSPLGMAITGDGQTLYLAAFGSGKIAVFDTTRLENNTFVPSSANHIAVTGGGPTGLVLDETRNQLYVLTRFDNAVSVIDTVGKSEIKHYALHNPEPPSVVQGRPFLYDANLTSSNGETSCGTCHVFGDLDSIAWDLGDPTGTVVANMNEAGPLGGGGGGLTFHPMKGPMTTQSLRGMAKHGPTHWRGDRQALVSDLNTEEISFKKFSVAFVGLLGDDAEPSIADMDAFTQFALQLTYPPNPNRLLDNSLTPVQQQGKDFLTVPGSTAGILSCDDCHQLSPSLGLFGSSGLMSIEGETQEFKIPHLRNMYQKVGRFGMPANDSIVPGDGVHTGDQIRGFGFLHDGSVDTLFRFHGAPLFNLTTTDQRVVEQFMYGFDTNLAPVVGQQVTLTSVSSAAVGNRISLLKTRAQLGECELTVKGMVAGIEKSWLMTAGSFTPDTTAEVTLSDGQLRALASQPNQELTYTCVPVGSGMRVGLDRDQDGFLNRNDFCPAIADSGIDSDGDNRGDACDNCTLVANSDQRDTDGDGYGNICDADLNQDLQTDLSDFSVFRIAFSTADPDADFNGSGSVDLSDFSLFRVMFRSAPGPSALNP